jgi:hypothetical protein
METPDFTLRSHGSICILTPVTDAAREWCGGNLPEDVQVWGGGYVIESRYVGDIVAGFQAEGLTI